MSLFKPLPVLLLAALLLCSCAGNGGHTAPQQVDAPSLNSLPPLPEGGDADWRIGSAIDTVVIEADQYGFASPGCIIQGDNLVLNAGVDQIEWAIYALPGAEEDYAPQSLTRFLLLPSGSLWMAVANYASGRWEIVGKSGSLLHSFSYDGNWQDYVSGSGNLYCAVIAASEAARLDNVVFTVEDTRPPQTPLNLSATPGELSATLQWEAITDPRVNVVRVYRSLDPGMAGAVLSATIPVPETSTLISGLDHNETHYFTVRSFSVLLGQESPDSNIASCQPLPPNGETFLPPQGLAANPAPGSAELSWDAYTDPRASHIRVYSSATSDMASPTLEAELPATDTAFKVEGLEPGVEVFFALTAWWEAATIESDYSGVASCIPGEQSTGLMEGGWARYGNDRDSSGYAALSGPDSLLDITSVGLTTDKTGKCRTSPVIDNLGRVYAVSRDAQLNCYSPDLSELLWRTDANIALSDLPDPAPLVVNGQAPLLDSLGNIYFVAAEMPVDSQTGAGWLLSFDDTGDYRWRFELGSIYLDENLPYPSINMHPDGTLTCVGKGNEVLFGVSTSGSQAWVNEDGAESGRLYYADMAMDGNGLVGLPIHGSGPAIDPRPHWRSYDGSSGSQQQTHLAMGTPYNLYGGIFMPNGFFYYPSKNTLRSIDPTDGSFHDQSEKLVDIVGAPARDGNGEFIFFAENQGGGISGFASFHCNGFNDDFPPTQAPVWSMSLNTVTVTCKPAVDANHTVLFTDNTGRILMIKWDPQQPPGDGNPTLAQVKLETTFAFSSFALAPGAAYVCSEDNRLYIVGSPLLPD